MTDTVLWENQRGAEQGGFVERLTAVDDGIRYERIAPEEDQAVYPDLRPAPFPDLAAALAALPDLLLLHWDDEVTALALPAAVIVEHVQLESEVWDEEISLAGKDFVLRGGFVLPIDTDPIDAWSNGDDYDTPGGDRTSLLYRFGTLYLQDGLDRGIVSLGHHATLDEAMDEWVETYIPGGWATYLAVGDDDE